MYVSQTDGMGSGFGKLTGGTQRPPLINTTVNDFQNLKHTVIGTSALTLTTVVLVFFKEGCSVPAMRLKRGKHKSARTDLRFTFRTMTETSKRLMLHKACKPNRGCGVKYM